MPMRKPATLTELAEAAWRTTLRYAQRRERLQRRTRGAPCRCSGPDGLRKRGLITRPSGKNLRRHCAMRLTLSAERCLVPCRAGGSHFAQAHATWRALRSSASRVLVSPAISGGGAAIVAECLAAGATLRPRSQRSAVLPRPAHPTRYGERCVFSNLLTFMPEHTAGRRQQPIPMPFLQPLLTVPQGFIPSVAAAFAPCFGGGPPCFVGR
eukprot:TRINITY_DN1828_c0_g1_i2.p2 TRINITY_DN1828_c0_g1~~TRINITY_DN1828_c0_g1_i2.p2  ORF type:complete len:210 (+),score=28.60 TRINITY_DN1828_c0_g1_i2:170-799(+)